MLNNVINLEQTAFLPLQYNLDNIMLTHDFSLCENL